MPTALALRHLPHEHAGLFADLLAARGVELRTVDSPQADVAAIDPLADDLAIVLGGPISANDDAAFPFVAAEIALLKARCAAGRPCIGICLGSQILARALGATVAPAPAKEIGYAPIRVAGGARNPFAPFAGGAPVLHWHGEGVTLPVGAVALASTDITPVQAFLWRDCALGIQFHPELPAADLETWLVGGVGELEALRLDPHTLRDQARKYGPEAERLGRQALNACLDLIGL